MLGAETAVNGSVKGGSEGGRDRGTEQVMGPRGGRNAGEGGSEPATVGMELFPGTVGDGKESRDGRWASGVVESEFGRKAGGSEG